MQTDAEHPVAQRVHVAFIAPTPAHVDRFGRAGVDAGFTDDGPAGAWDSLRRSQQAEKPAVAGFP